MNAASARGRRSESPRQVRWQWDARAWRNVMFTFPFGAPVPLALTWPSGIGVELFAWAVWLVCLQLGRLATFAAMRLLARRGKAILTSTPGQKRVPRIAS